MGLYNLQDGYSLGTWYDDTGAYDLNAGVDALLDGAREILESDAYMFQGVSFPKGQDIFVNPGQTFSGTLNLTPYSYLLYMTGWSQNKNQFTMRIFDKGAQADLYFKQFAWFPTVMSNMGGRLQYNNGQEIFIGDEDKPFGPYFFQAPLVILPPGVLQVQITNVSTIPAGPPSPNPPNAMQVLFAVAVPKSTTTLQNRKVQTSTDTSGLTSLLNLAS